MTGFWASCISATTSTSPRPVTLHWMTIRRRTSSRLIVFGPLDLYSLANDDSGVVPPFGRSIDSRLSASMSSRYFSSMRTSRSNVRWPSRTLLTTSPFIAVEMYSFTYDGVSPYNSSWSRSSWMRSCGISTCGSTSKSVTPSISRITAAISWAFCRRMLRSSP